MAPDQPPSSPLGVDPIMTEVRARVREHLRERLAGRGGAAEFDDATLFRLVEDTLRRALAASETRALLLPELLGDRDHWQLSTSLDVRSHRPRLGPLLVGFKRRVLLPVARWLFEYSRGNFERQQRVNEVLFACVQTLAIEQVKLQRQFDERGLPRGPGADAPPSGQ